MIRGCLAAWCEAFICSFHEHLLWVFPRWHDRVRILLRVEGSTYLIYLNGGMHVGSVWSLRRSLCPR